MSYEASRATKNLKVLISSNTHDHGHSYDGVYNLRETIVTPHNTYASIGLEKMYFTHPFFLPEVHCHGTIYSTIYSGSIDLLPDDFKGVNLPNFQRKISLVELDLSSGGGAQQLTDVLECLVVVLSAKANEIDVHWEQTEGLDPLQFDLTCTEWDKKTKKLKQLNSGIIMDEECWVCF